MSLAQERLPVRRETMAYRTSRSRNPINQSVIHQTNRQGTKGLIRLKRQLCKLMQGEQLCNSLAEHLDVEGGFL